MKAKPNASNRTKNRIANHSGLKLVRRSPSCSALGGVPALLLEGPTWFGWLPESEVELEA